MKITRGDIRIWDVHFGKDHLPVFEITLGNRQICLRNKKALGPFRALDHFAIAVALREMADKLDRQLV